MTGIQLRAIRGDRWRVLSPSGALLGYVDGPGRPVAGETEPYRLRWRRSGTAACWEAGRFWRLEDAVACAGSLAAS